LNKKEVVMLYIFIFLAVSMFSNLVIEATTVWQLPSGVGVGGGVPSPSPVKPKPANPSTKEKEEL
jgi:hypothetical protein